MKWQISTTALAAALSTVLTGCAATYKAPQSLDQVADERIEQSRTILFTAARRALVASGNQVLSADEQSGTISTVARDFRLTPELADCGTTMGIDYLKDNRTSTKLVYGLIIDEGRVNIRTTLQGEYKPGDVAQNITLTCVSRGVLEQQLLGKIRAEIRR